MKSQYQYHSAISSKFNINLSKILVSFLAVTSLACSGGNSSLTDENDIPSGGGTGGNGGYSISVVSSGLNLTEGGSGSPSVVLSAPMQDAFSVSWKITDSNGNEASSDFNPSSGTLSFNAFQIVGSISVVSVDDADIEGSESFQIELSNPTLSVTVPAANTASFDMEDNDVANFRPVANAVVGTAFDEDTSSTITLDYTDNENDLATACAVSNLTGVSESTSCSCDGAGVCTVGITGTADFNGTATFDYTVTAVGGESLPASVNVDLNPIDDAPRDYSYHTQ